jgi:2-polyprenyl-6-methoxyphenol hydroxylase-like FAD-dependent oxidoreductase
MDVAVDVDPDVLVVGAGPAGLTLAAELGLAGVGVLVVEQLPGPSGFCRGFNLNARSLALLDRRGIVDRFLAAGPKVTSTVFAAGARLDLSALPADHPYVLGIAQTRVEELLEERAAELGVAVRRGHRLTGLCQDADAVTATLDTQAGPVRLTARYLVGCDGGRSTVRRLAGIGFPGTPASRYLLLGDVTMAEPEGLPFGPTRTEHGSVFVIPRPGYVRVITADPDPPADRDTPVTLPYLQAAVDRAAGRHVPLAEPRWLSRFSDAARQADRYVAGRVLLAGDAAHIHPPAGAVGVNVAIDDAMNLGWKLAGVVRGWAPRELLATYHDERHAVGARLLRTTRAQALLGEPDPRLAPLADLVTELSRLAPVNRYLAELVTGLDIRYPPAGPDGPDHPWLGRLVPNLTLTAGDNGTTTLAELLAPGRPVLLDLAGEDREPRHRRLTVHRGRCPDHPELRGVLVRPDGHAAWLTPPMTTTERDRTLATWFDLPTAAG